MNRRHIAAGLTAAALTLGGVAVSSAAYATTPEPLPQPIPEFSEVWWAMPDGGNASKVTWPQTYTPVEDFECGITYQVDTYPSEAVPGLIADGILYEGEDSAVVVSWRFVLMECAENPPTTTPPTTEPPTTEPPTTEPPATEPPATEPPATEPPVVTPPVETPPVVDAPPVVDVPAEARTFTVENTSAAPEQLAETGVPVRGWIALAAGFAFVGAAAAFFGRRKQAN
jgi:hypothetical protein